MKKVKLLSLFSGIGAFEKALDKIEREYELVNYCEIDKYASKSYSMIHECDESLNLGDITKIDTSKLPNDIDILTYGFPCQDISLAGKQKGFEADGERTRSGLFFEALRIIEDTKPRVAIAENVKNLTSKKFKKEFEIVLSSLEEVGYTNYWKVLNAKDYGIPQNRERVFIVSIRKDIDKGYTFPQGFELTLRLKDMLEEQVEEKYYLSQKGIEYFKKQAENRGENLHDHNDRRILTLAHGRSKGSNKNDDICPTLDTQFSNNWHGVLLEPKLVGGIGEKNFGKQFRQGNRVYDSNEIAVCLTAQPVGNAGGNSYLYQLPNFRIRKLTPLECFRLMGFDDDDFNKITGISNTQLYKQAGNSIVVNVLINIFKELFKAVDFEGEKIIEKPLIGEKLTKEGYYQLYIL